MSETTEDYDLGWAPLPNVAEVSAALFDMLHDTWKTQKIAHADYLEEQFEYDSHNPDEDYDDDDQWGEGDPGPPTEVTTPATLIFDMLFDLAARMAVVVNGIDTRTIVCLEMSHASGDRRIVASVPDYEALRNDDAPYRRRASSTCGD